LRDLDLVASVLSAGVEASGAHGLCVRLVTALAADCGVRAAMLYELSRSGQLVLREQFGFARDVVEAFASPSLFEQLPIGKSILDSSPQFITHQEVMEEIDRAKQLTLPFDGFLHLGCYSAGVPTGGIALAIKHLDGRLETPGALVMASIATVGAARLRQLNLRQSSTPAGRP
jgi:hypothetical protein